MRDSAVVRRRTRAGLTLLEVLVAITLLALTGLSTLEMVRTAARFAGAASAAESEVQDASQLLDAMNLWSRTELDQRLGERVQGHWRVEITRPVPDLYLIVVRDSTGGATLLRTGIFRARTIGATTP